MRRRAAIQRERLTVGRSQMSDDLVIGFADEGGEISASRRTTKPNTGVCTRPTEQAALPLPRASRCRLASC